MAKKTCAFIRVVQSNNGWTQPCGLDYGRGNHFASTSGFGFEEWMNSKSMQLNNASRRLIHIEAFRLGFNPNKINNGTLYLWVYDWQVRKKYIVGVIKKYEVIERDEVHNIINYKNTVNVLKDEIIQSKLLGQEIKDKVLTEIEWKLKNPKEYKFNLVVEDKDIKILRPEDWIELPGNVFRHNRFVVHYNLNEELRQFIEEQNI
jgi:hypothetical protein